MVLTQQGGAAFSSWASVREGSISNGRLEVSPGVPEVLLNLRDRVPHVRWRHFLPTRHVLDGRPWGKVRVAPIAPNRPIRIMRSANSRTTGEFADYVD